MNHNAKLSENLSDVLANHNKRFIEIDLLRGLAIILMIMGHSFIIHPINILEVPWCSSVSHWIYTFHMELFSLFLVAFINAETTKPTLEKNQSHFFTIYFLGNSATVVPYSQHITSE